VLLSARGRRRAVKAVQAPTHNTAPVVSYDFCVVLDLRQYIYGFQEFKSSFQDINIKRRRSTVLCGDTGCYSRLGRVCGNTGCCSGLQKVEQITQRLSDRGTEMTTSVVCCTRALANPCHCCVNDSWSNIQKSRALSACCGLQQPSAQAAGCLCV
jgi:hypothetical protein